MSEEEEEESLWLKQEQARIREKPIAQPEDMDCQGGSDMDFLSFHLRNVKGKERNKFIHER